MSSDTKSGRRETILRAAFDVFGNYGFRRTSMDDIAKAAGVSRPALYQDFANKGEIFRGIVEAHMGHVSAELETFLDQGLPLDTLLKAILKTAVIEPHRMMEDMPHGEEMLGIKSEFAGDLFEKWNGWIQEYLQRGMMQHLDREPVLVENLAKMMSLAITGMKARGMDSARKAAEIDTLISVAVSSIRPDLKRHKSF